MAQDCILLPDIQIMACHGCNPEEKITPQPFSILLILRLDTKAAAAADDLCRTVDYGALYLRVQEFATKNTFQLIETLADRIAKKVLQEEPLVEDLTVQVTKSAAKAGEATFPAAVRIERCR